MVKYKIKFDRKKCIAAGTCAQVAPETWNLDDDGYAVQKVKEISDDKLDINVKAAKSCPAHAIEIWDEKGKKVV